MLVRRIYKGAFFQGKLCFYQNTCAAAVVNAAADANVEMHFAARAGTKRRSSAAHIFPHTHTHNT